MISFADGFTLWASKLAFEVIIAGIGIVAVGIIVLIMHIKRKTKK